MSEQITHNEEMLRTAKAIASQMNTQLQQAPSPVIGEQGNYKADNTPVNFTAVKLEDLGKQSLTY